jgi:pimeloyl-ACP methyl ester carboxylesterase
MSDGTVVFLHGLGAGPESWDAQLAALPDGFVGFAPRLPGLRDADGVAFTLRGAANAVRDEVERRGAGRVHLCGLSLGAMIATRFAIDYPDRVASIVLSGSQVHPNPLLMKLQNTMIRVLPRRMVATDGMSRRTMLAILGGLAAIDFRADLPGITAPTLVLCGAKDRPNLPAARELAAAIPGAELQIVPGAGHQWNTQLPEEFSARLGAFYRTLSPETGPA